LDTTGTITNFTSTVNNLFDIGGDAYRMETASKRLFTVDIKFVIVPVVSNFRPPSCRVSL